MHQARRVIAAVVLAAMAAGGSVAFGQDFERIAPKEPAGAPAEPPRLPPPPEPSGDEAVLVESLRGVVFRAGPGSVTERVEGVEGVVAEGLPLLQTGAGRALAEPMLGRPASLRSLSELVRLVVLHYRDNDRPIVDVYLPEQDVTSGVVQVVVLEGRLGQVRAVGNRWFSDRVLVSSIRTVPGGPISGQRVGDDAAWLNQNPFRSVDVVFTPGNAPGLTDLELRTRDVLPMRLYGGLEDTGNDSTGQNRVFTGFNWGDVFGLDHRFNYQFTADTGFDRFRAHSVTYAVPLPWRHTATLFGSYATTEPNIPPFDQEGESWQASGRYAVPLGPPAGAGWAAALRHELTLGFDFKQSNNNLEFGGDTVFGTITDVAQFMLGYAATLPDDWGLTTAGVEAFLSPGGMTDRNRDGDFEAVRPGADAEYAYVTLGAERVTRLTIPGAGDWTWHVRGQGQWSNENLLPSEQMGIGGQSSVRGFDERLANGDLGVLVSTELRTPAVSLLKLVGLERVGDQCQALAFVDYGVVRNKDRQAGEPDDLTLAGAGAGVRWTVGRVLTLRYDHGWALTDSGLADRLHRGHLSVVVSLPW